MNILTSIGKVNTYYNRFGFNGLKYLVDRIVKKNAIIEVTPRHYRSAVSLRNNTSDVDTFSQIFVGLDYNIDFGFTPETIVDCGANAGFATLYFKNRFPGATIIAVEPEPSNYALLVKNTRKYPDVHCLNNGIWNRTTNLEIIDSGKGNWGFTTEEVDYENENTIKAISIDEIMARFNISKIDVLKIDIEGSEQQLFEKNYEGWLSKTRCLIIELHDWLRNSCSDNFYGAMSHYTYTKVIKGENVICIFGNK